LHHRKVLSDSTRPKKIRDSGGIAKLKAKEMKKKKARATEKEQEKIREKKL
jgi:hypothetical protein